MAIDSERLTDQHARDADRLKKVKGQEGLVSQKGVDTLWSIVQEDFLALKDALIGKPRKKKK